LGGEGQNKIMWGTGPPAASHSCVRACSSAAVLFTWKFETLFFCRGWDCS